jgi:hypothetical protein
VSAGGRETVLFSGRCGWMGQKSQSRSDGGYSNAIRAWNLFSAYTSLDHSSRRSGKTGTGRPSRHPSCIARWELPCRRLRPPLRCCRWRSPTPGTTRWPSAGRAMQAII